MIQIAGIIYSVHLKVGKFANAGSSRFAFEPIQVTIEKLEPEWGRMQRCPYGEGKIPTFKWTEYIPKMIQNLGEIQDLG